MDQAVKWVFWGDVPVISVDQFLRYQVQNLSRERRYRRHVELEGMCCADLACGPRTRDKEGKKEERKLAQIKIKDKYS